MSKIIRLSFAVLMAVALSAVAMAQSTTSGAIGGVVTNPNKEVVPGAAISVVSECRPIKNPAPPLTEKDAFAS